jgi:hypothetical protein
MKPPKLDVHARATLITVGAFLFLLIVVSLMLRTGFLEPGVLQLRDRLTPGIDASIKSSSSIPVEIGAYIENIYVFSAEAKTFDADGWLWLKWPQSAQDFFSSHNLTPEQWLYFVNQVDDWDGKIEPATASPVRQQDGRYYQKFKFSAHFYARDLDFRKYPFQTIKIPLMFEASHDRSVTTEPLLYLIPDETASGVGEFIELMGYKTTGFDISAATREYGSNLGLPEIGNQPVRTTQISFEVTYQQSVTAAVLTQFFPLMVVMMLVFFSPLLSAVFWEIRLSIPPTAMLTLIFLQQGYKDKLPPLTYMTYMDFVYNALFFVNLVLFALFLWGANLLQQTAEDQKPEVAAYIDDMDRKFQAGVILMAFILMLGNWFLIESVAK